jgi:multicomponent Na+:H+ antiporter subunit B
MAALFGDAFLTGQWLFLGATEDSYGLPLSTVLLFDVGVYLVVFGSALALALALEEAA